MGNIPVVPVQELKSLHPEIYPNTNSPNAVHVAASDTPANTPVSDVTS